jgi:hypothetical protein
LCENTYREDKPLRENTRQKESTMKRFISTLGVVFMLACATSSFAAFAAGMSVQAKVDMLISQYLSGAASCTAAGAPMTCCTAAATGANCSAPVIKMALGLQSANTAIGHSTTAYSSFTDLDTAHGYTTGGNTLTSCTAVSTTGATSPATEVAADFNCTGGLVWTATDSTGITADCAVLYNSTSGKIIALYTFTSAAATGNGATFTITPPTVANGTRGMAYIQ